MQSRELKIAGAFELTPKVHVDDRGHFHEWFAAGQFEGLLGHGLSLGQANMSLSKAGVVRGIHFAEVPPGQAKYVICPRGAVLDVAIDIRIGSPTFGQWDSVVLDDATHRAIYLSEGLGHAFMSLEDNSTVIYLCSEPYTPTREHGIHPLDPDIAIPWPTESRTGRRIVATLSDKDAAAPSLAAMAAEGSLPTMAEAQRYVDSLRRHFANLEA